MAEDIAPELLKKIQEEFRKNCSQDKELQEISRKVADGTANCVDLENYAIAAGEMLAKALHNNVSGDILPDGKMYYNIASRILPPNLEECHVMVADIAEGIYGVLNEKAGIHIKAQRPELNRDRINGIVDYVSNAEQYEDVRKSTEQSIVNFSQSVATDAVHKNADFQYKAGLSPKIRRSAEGNCCKWCQSLEGTYDYADVRNTGNDVWRRHRDCKCEVTYDPGTGKVQNAHSKTWSTMDEDARAERIRRAQEAEREDREKEEAERAERMMEEREREQKREKEQKIEEEWKRRIKKDNELSGRHYNVSGFLTQEAYREALVRWSTVEEIKGLSVKERNHVYEEFDNWLPRELDSPVVRKDIGDYTYTAICKGHNQYKIIDKKRIDGYDNLMDEVLSEVIGKDWKKYDQ